MTTKAAKDLVIGDRVLIPTEDGRDGDPATVTSHGLVKCGTVRIGFQAEQYSTGRILGADWPVRLADPAAPPPAVLFAKSYDHDNARGTVEVVDGPAGPIIRVDGRDVLFVDLFPPAAEGDGHPAQILVLDEPAHDEPVAKVILGERIGVTLNRDAGRVAIPGGVPIHDGQDIYGFEAAR